MAVEVDNRWLPPSPHREKVLEELASGRLTLDERGHGIAPIVRHEDGGTIELPNMRWNGERWKRAEKPGGSSRQTSYSDVCGCSFEMMDLFKRGADFAEADAGRISELQDDVLYMIARMDKRHSQYELFAGELESLARQIREAAPPKPEEARECYERANKLSSDGPPSREVVEQILDLTERARLVAQRQEDTLKARRDLAIQAMLLFEAIRGGRNWQKAIVEQQSRRKPAQAST